MKKALICVLAFAVVLSLCACAAQTPSTSSAPSSAAKPGNQKTAPPAQATLIEPEQLISKAEAEGVAGSSLGEAKKTEQPVVGLKLAVYESGGGFLQVGLTQQAFIQAKNNTPQSLFEGIRAAFPDAPKGGVGDDSFLASPGIHILYKGYYITVSLGLNSAKADPEKLKQAGKIACDNLEKLLK